MLKSSSAIVFPSVFDGMLEADCLSFKLRVTSNDGEPSCGDSWSSYGDCCC